MVGLLVFWLWVMSPLNGLLAGLASWYCLHFRSASIHFGMCVIAAITIAAITAHNAAGVLRAVRAESMAGDPASPVSATQPGKDGAL